MIFFPRRRIVPPLALGNRRAWFAGPTHPHPTESGDRRPPPGRRAWFLLLNTLSADLSHDLLMSRLQLSIEISSAAFAPP